jgi:hypothetical protein
VAKATITTTTITSMGVDIAAVVFVIVGVRRGDGIAVSSFANDGRRRR